MSLATRVVVPNRLAAHPATVDETYGQHCRFALRVASRLAAAAAAAAVHAVYPPAFETTASEHIKELNALVTTGARADLAAVADATDTAA